MPETKHEPVDENGLPAVGMGVGTGVTVGASVAVGDVVGDGVAKQICHPADVPPSSEFHEMTVLGDTETPSGPEEYSGGPQYLVPSTVK